MIILWILVALAALLLLTTFFCYLKTFFALRRPIKGEFDLPKGAIYEPFYETIKKRQKEVRTLPYREFNIRSFDGLNLHAKYYECQAGAPIELMFHGYRGTAERDLCGAVQRCFSIGHNAFIVNQRTSGKSGGRTITFGIRESRDCDAWVDFMIKEFGADVQIMLAGISMGAATVLIAAGRPQPPQVVGVLADCGYTSAKEIIQKTIREMHLPPTLLYPFVKLGARLIGRFDLEETSPIESLKSCTLPVLFFHGDTDDYVPWSMSKENYEACAAPKHFVTIPQAGHGLCYLVDPATYLKEMEDFYSQHGIPTKLKTVTM